MNIYKCSESEHIIINQDAGHVSIHLKDGAGIFKMSLPEAMAINAQICAMIADSEMLPEDIIKQIQSKIHVEIEEVK